MRSYWLTGIILLVSFLLISCTAKNTGYLRVRPQTDLAQETWQYHIEKNPARWTMGADHWFFTGNPNVVELANREAPYATAMSTMTVRVPDFTQVKVNGCFQVQLFGSTNHNSVYILGPNAAVGRIKVNIIGDTFYIYQKDTSPLEMNRVIIRIGIKNLRSLTQRGSGSIIGRQLNSDRLSVNAYGNGNVLLAGHLNLHHINSLGNGNITILGAYSPAFDIKATGRGYVNISGTLGIQSINHTGTGNINLIGVNTSSLNIVTAGAGKIGLIGPCISLKKIDARGNTRVYIYWVKTQRLDAFSSGNARIGLAGYAQNLYVTATGFSSFLGRSLHAQNTFVKTYDQAHANITASNKAFAKAMGSSSIYFFGSRARLSSFTGNYGVIVVL